MVLEIEAYLACYFYSCKIENYKYYLLNLDGFPYAKSFITNDDLNIFVLELLGKSLGNIFDEYKKFSIKTVCMIGIQILDRIEYMHIHKRFLHRDIKPENFLLGLENKSHIIYIIDFGLSGRLVEYTTRKHIKFITDKNPIGTIRYSSINNLKGYELSRRDDLEALGYMLIYFLRGNLPWQGLNAKNEEEKLKKILEKKISTSAEELCKGFPNEFAEYINYTRNLEFEAKPDYKYLRGLFYTILERQNCSFDFWYDWVKEKPNITDKISIERYIKNNTNISLEIYQREDENKSEEKKIVNGNENIINEQNNIKDNSLKNLDLNNINQNNSISEEIKTK